MKGKIKSIFLSALILAIFSIATISCFIIINGNASKKAQLDVDANEVVENQVISQSKNIDEDEVADLLDYQLSNFGVSGDEQTTRIIDVVLINATDNAVFTDALAQDFVKRFNENIDNDYLSVHEYYYIMSRGKVNLWANVRVSQSNENKAFFADKSYSNLTEEDAIWITERYRNDTRLVSENYGALYDAKCSILPCERPVNNNYMSWPHAWFAGLMLLPYNKADVPTIVHESLHMMKLHDLYTNNGVKAVSSFDIMSDTYNGNVSLSAYYRKELGWISESDYSDFNNTAIETISQDGRYTLNVNTSPNGVIAYKFGTRRADAFYVEYRKNSNTFENGIYGSGLVVYRINKVASGNLKYNDSGLYSMYVFSNDGTSLDKWNGLIKAGKSIGSVEENSKLALKYSDGEQALFVITDIVENANGTISFSIKSNSSEYEGDTLYSMSEFKLWASNKLTEVMTGVSEIVINPVGFGNKIIIAFKGYNLTDLTEQTIELLQTISQKVTTIMERNGGVEAIRNGIDYIVNGTAYSNLVNVISSADAVSAIQSIMDRIAGLFNF